MQAIIDLGKKQYTVEPKQIFYAELLPHEIGSEISISTVLFFRDENNMKIGKPYINGMVVKAKIIEEIKAKKIHGFKYKRRKNYYRQWGHRQAYHKLEVLSIQASGSN